MFYNIRSPLYKIPSPLPQRWCWKRRLFVNGETGWRRRASGQRRRQAGGSRHCTICRHAGFRRQRAARARQRSEQPFFGVLETVLFKLFPALYSRVCWWARCFGVVQELWYCSSVGFPVGKGAHTIVVLRLRGRAKYMICNKTHLQFMGGGFALETAAYYPETKRCCSRVYTLAGQTTWDNYTLFPTNVM